MHSVFPSSLRGRLLLLLLLAIAPWFVVVAYGMWSDWRKATADALSDARALIRATALEQDRLLKSTRNLLEVLSAVPEIRAGTGAACAARLREVHGRTAGYVNFGVTDAQGRLLCAAKGGWQNFSDRDWYREMVKAPRFVVGRYVIGKISGLPVLPTAYPILDGEGRLQRIVWAAFDVTWLGQMLATARPSAEVVLSILDHEGVVVARHPHDPALIGKPHPVPWLVEAVTTGQGRGEGAGEVARGDTRLIAFERLPSSDGQGGVYVAASYSREAVLAPVLRDFRRNLIFLGVFTLLVLGAAWFLTEAFVLRRVSSLIQATRRIAAGDFSARAALGTGGGELSDLGRAFDAMAASLQQSMLQSRRIMEVAPEAILVTDTEGRIVMVNPRTESLFGYTREELIGQPVEMLVPASQRAAHARDREAYRRQPRVREMGTQGLDLAGQRKDGSTFPVDISLGPLETEQGTWVVAAVRDLSERKRFEDELLHQATHDALTGLPNRLLFRELLLHGMAQAQRAEKLLAVLFLDLDGFKNINDTLGHAQGDVLLREVARRIVGALRKDDVVARQGGDEFTILLSGISEVQDITAIADKLLAAVAEPYVAAGHEMYVTASIGITVYPFDDADADNLLRNADTAMYRAKESGKNAYRFYTAEMNAAVQERMEIEHGLRQALREERFVLHYQPQVNVATGQVVGVEALLRWMHPERGLLSPASFIAIAEDSGLIEPIGEWVLRAACRQIMDWRQAGMEVKVAVNLSARQFRRPTLADTVERVLAETGVAACPGLLELELTESMMMNDMDRNVATLSRLREMGLKLSIDDFGTGYSSLAYLKRFPIHILKIDKSFIDGITADPGDAAIARSVVSLGHSLNLGVIAEGVETREQWEWLRQAGCDQAQGYFFGKPMPAQDVEAMLRQGRPLLSSAGMQG